MKRRQGRASLPVSGCLPVADLGVLPEVEALLHLVRQWDDPGWYLLVGFFPQLAGAWSFYAVFDTLKNPDSRDGRRRYLIAISAVSAPVLSLLLHLFWAHFVYGTDVAFGGALQYIACSEFWFPLWLGLFCFCRAAMPSTRPNPAVAWQN